MNLAVDGRSLIRLGDKTTHGGTVVLFLLLLAAFTLPGCEARISIAESAVNTSTWKTHAIGRFLIDLPPDAQCKFFAIFWKEDIIWRRDLTLDAARSEAGKLADKYKATPHKEFAGKSQLIDVLEFSGHHANAKFLRWISGNYAGCLTVLIR
jgi:hypothetical protein